MAAGEGEIMTMEARKVLSHEEKNHELYLRQKQLLENFLKRGAISKAQHDKSLHDLTVKMGIRDAE